METWVLLGERKERRGDLKRKGSPRLTTRSSLSQSLPWAGRLHRAANRRTTHPTAYLLGSSRFPHQFCMKVIAWYAKTIRYNVNLRTKILRLLSSCWGHPVERRTRPVTCNNLGTLDQFGWHRSIHNTRLGNIFCKDFCDIFSRFHSLWFTFVWNFYHNTVSRNIYPALFTKDKRLGWPTAWAFRRELCDM